MKILMVCLGNICRSPLAEGIMRHRTDGNWIVDSAGTGNWHVGNRPDKRSIAIAQKYGIDISTQRARQFSSKDFDQFDLIFAMDSSNYTDILELAKTDEHRSKVKLMLGEGNVPDPYYGGDDGFEHVFQLLDEAIQDFILQHRS
ncbi:low molecular weight protein-tyrosine-phosphatase [Moheibacter stercoris]|uniref:protein-tyrosine-phosphatase n=1 Tax=Moheibacter stercoris TaxID=1628251 RepID=A0ABV2LSN4_9FLAO